MLEIIVDLCRRSEGEVGSGNTAERIAGDIIVAKKQPCVWGNEEKRLFLITYLQDDDLEKSMESAKSAMSVYPYAVYDKVELDGGGFEMDLMNRSKYRVNLDMFKGSPGLDPTNITQEPVEPNDKKYLELSDLILDDSFRR